MQFFVRHVTPSNMRIFMQDQLLLYCSQSNTVHSCIYSLSALIFFNGIDSTLLEIFKNLQDLSKKWMQTPEAGDHHHGGGTWCLNFSDHVPLVNVWQSFTVCQKIMVFGCFKPFSAGGVGEEKRKRGLTFSKWHVVIWYCTTEHHTE